MATTLSSVGVTFELTGRVVSVEQSTLSYNQVEIFYALTENGMLFRRAFNRMNGMRRREYDFDLNIQRQLLFARKMFLTDLVVFSSGVLNDPQDIVVCVGRLAEKKVFLTNLVEIIPVAVGTFGAGAPTSDTKKKLFDFSVSGVNQGLLISEEEAIHHQFFVHKEVPKPNQVLSFTLYGRHAMVDFFLGGTLHKLSTKKELETLPYAEQVGQKWEKVLKGDPDLEINWDIIAEPVLEKDFGSVNRPFVTVDARSYPWFGAQVISRVETQKHRLRFVEFTTEIDYDGLTENELPTSGERTHPPGLMFPLARKSMVKVLKDITGMIVHDGYILFFGQTRNLTDTNWWVSPWKNDLSEDSEDSNGPGSYDSRGFTGFTGFGPLDSSGLVYWVHVESVGLFILNVFSHTMIPAAINPESATISEVVDTTAQNRRVRQVGINARARGTNEILKTPPVLWTTVQSNESTTLTCTTSITVPRVIDVDALALAFDSFQYWWENRTNQQKYVNAMRIEGDLMIIDNVAKRELANERMTKVTVPAPSSLQDEVFTVCAWMLVSSAFSINVDLNYILEKQLEMFLQMFLSSDTVVSDYITVVDGVLESLVYDNLKVRNLVANLRFQLGVCRDGLDVIDVVTLEPLAVAKRPLDVVYVLRDDVKAEEGTNSIYFCYNKESILNENADMVKKIGTKLSFGGIKFVFASSDARDAAFDQIVSAPPNSVFVFRSEIAEIRRLYTPDGVRRQTKIVGTQRFYKLVQVQQRSVEVDQMFRQRPRLRREVDTRKRAREVSSRATALPLVPKSAESNVPKISTDTSRTATEFSTKSMFLRTL